MLKHSVLVAIALALATGAEAQTHTQATRTRVQSVPTTTSTAQPECQGVWTEWTACSAPCGVGEQKRKWKVTVAGLCPFQDGHIETQQCMVKSCVAEAQPTFSSIRLEVSDLWCQQVCKPDSDGVYPGACIMNDASPLDQKCTAVAPTATTIPTYSTPTYEGVPNQQGTVPPQQQERKKIEVMNCVGQWTAWGQCSMNCGGGAQLRTFQITIPASPQGRRCEFTHGETQSRACNSAPCTSVQQPTQAQIPMASKPCRSISPEVTDWWCLRNCLPDTYSVMPAACMPHAVTPAFQKCQCEDAAAPMETKRFGCWSTSPSTPDAWCSSTCTSMNEHGDLHAACKPGAFQECQCRFRALPPDLQPPAGLVPPTQLQQQQSNPTQVQEPKAQTYPSTTQKVHTATATQGPTHIPGQGVRYTTPTQQAGQVPSTTQDL